MELSGLVSRANSGLGEYRMRLLAIVLGCGLSSPSSPAPFARRGFLFHAADQREVKEVLEGHLTTDHTKPVSKYVRIFLSSDLTGIIATYQALVWHWLIGHCGTCSSSSPVLGSYN